MDERALEAATDALINCMNYSSDYGPDDWARAAIDAARASHE